jgi:hypothetical protein
VDSNSCLAARRPEISAQWHPTKNGNLTPYDVAEQSNIKVWWKCPVSDDHEWEANIASRTNPLIESGCSCCAGRTIVKSNCLATTRPHVAAEWHPTKNGTLTPYNIGRNYGERKVWWICNKGHEWEAMCSNRTNPLIMSGCPICKGSKGEKRIAAFLSLNGIVFVPQKHQKGAGRFDFLTQRNGKTIAIEFQGAQHYRPEDFGSKGDKAKYRMFCNNIKRDKNKEKWCERNRTQLLCVPYWDQDRIEEILNDFFAGREPTFSEPPEVVKKYEPMRKKIIQRLRDKGEIE